MINFQITKPDLSLICSAPSLAILTSYMVELDKKINIKGVSLFVALEQWVICTKPTFLALLFCSYMQKFELQDQPEIVKAEMLNCGT